MSDSIIAYGASMLQPTAASLAAAGKADYREIVNELRDQNFDTVRFATYRTACKLRFIQKKFNLHLVDIWNIIESFRENGLNAVEYVSEVKISRIELLLSTIYHNLNKRLPAGQQIDTDKAISLLLSFLLAAYDRENVGKLRVFSIKVALASLCAGKLLDKLRYVFSQISDGSALMDHRKFADYLKEVLALPTAVFEGPTFGFTEACVKQCFDPNSKISINLFLDTLMADPCAPCLMWLPLLHRMASVEHVFHPVVCDACNKDSFTGFRYKCQRCHNYQLCQECFWRGRVSGSHTNQHEMKEYSSYKSPTKQLGHSISKSLQCMPHHTKHAKQGMIVPDYPERLLDLSNVVPSSPCLARHHAVQNYGAGQYAPYFNCTLDSSMIQRGPSSLPSPGRSPLFHEGCPDDEHKLIARYSAKLATRSIASVGRTDAIGSDNLGQRAMIARLEQKNKEINWEIQHLQAMQAASNSLAGSISATANESGLTVELDTLRQRKYELECRMQQLQDTRRDLLVQLENVMKVLKNQTPREGSPLYSTAAARLDGTIDASPSLTGSGADFTSRDLIDDRFAPPPPAAASTPATQRRAAGGAATQSDLLSAADSIAHTMSSLVRQLGSDDEEATSPSRLDRIDQRTPKDKPSPFTNDGAILH